jgi:uncharacterized phage-associated protein
MLIPFNFLKTAQAAGILIKAEPGRRISPVRLLKLLYMADRELLQERGRPIPGDRPIAMDHGPVPGRTYDIVKGTDYCSPTWDKYFRTAGRRDIELNLDPGVGRLTRREILSLREVSDRCGSMDDWALAELTHGFAEWQKNRPAEHAAREIPVQDLLEAVGLAPYHEELREVEKLAKAADELFGEAQQA